MNVNVIGTGIVIAIAGYFITRMLDKKMKNIEETPNKSEIELALRKIKEQFGPEIAKNVEKIYRLETRNFESEQYKKTKGAGTEAVTEMRPPFTEPQPKYYPYGWNSKLWDNNPEYKPTGTYAMKENIRIDGKTIKGGGTTKHFIIFPSVEAGMTHLADYLNRYENDALRWYAGTNEPKRKEYEKMLSTITTKYV